MAYASEIAVYVGICIPQDGISALREDLVPEGVLGSAGLLKVLGAVQFYDQSSAVAEEVHNIAPDGFLSVKWDAQMLQKIIPQMPFFLRHFPAELLGTAR